jgi:hypothetical protein
MSTFDFLSYKVPQIIYVDPKVNCLVLFDKKHKLENIIMKEIMYF